MEQGVFMIGYRKSPELTVAIAQPPWKQILLDQEDLKPASYLWCIHCVKEFCVKEFLYHSVTGYLVVILICVKLSVEWFKNCTFSQLHFVIYLWFLSDSGSAHKVNTKGNCKNYIYWYKWKNVTCCTFFSLSPIELDSSGVMFFTGPISDDSIGAFSMKRSMNYKANWDLT